MLGKIQREVSGLERSLGMIIYRIMKGNGSD